jgi:hypothetical protein
MQYNCLTLIDASCATTVEQMSKFPHDDFAKAYLMELLNTIGKATPNRPLKAETLFADLWFEPKAQSQEERVHLGLLGRLLPRNALIEVFRNPATIFEIRSCKHKLFSDEADRIRKATKQKKTVIETELPSLLLLMPTASAEIREGFGASPTETEGVYHFPKWERTALVVLHQLPKTRDTLWLRLLARSGEQQRAIAEFTALPAEVPLYASISDLLANYRAILETRGQLAPEDEELIMNLSTAYLKKQEEWKLEGKLEEKLEVARNLLREGSDVELIAKVTGLSIAEIQQLEG